MATYIQGVTDRIPEIKPFQPDYSFLMNALEYKQSAYNNAFNQINNIYSSVLNAPLTRGVNQERRDEFFKAAEENIKKISSLDLSLPQNVDVASSVFKPFYEDRNMVKDMVWTKQYNNQLNNALSFRDSQDKELKKQYWDKGVRALQYQKNAFAEASDDQALNMGAARYVPYVNVHEVAQKYLKDAGFDIKKTSFEGNWIVKYQNGQAAVTPMYQYLSSIMRNDPQIKAIYDTEAYVDYNDFIERNTQLYGDKEQAAAAYADQIMKSLPKEWQKYNERLNDDYKTISDVVVSTEDMIKNQGIVPGSDEHKRYLANLREKELLQVAKKNADFATELIDSESDYVAKAKMLKSQYLMDKDFKDAAMYGAQIKMDVDYEINPIAMENIKHQNAKELERYKKQLEQTVTPQGVINIPTTPGGDIDLGQAIDVNQKDLQLAKTQTAQTMAQLIGLASAKSVNMPIEWDGKKISPAELAAKAQDPNNAAKIADMYGKFDAKIKAGTLGRNPKFMGQWENIQQTLGAINQVETKFNEDLLNTLNNWKDTDQYKSAKGSFVNLDGFVKDGKIATEDQYVADYVAKRKANLNNSDRGIIYGGSSLGMGNLTGSYTDSYAKPIVEILETDAKREYANIKKQLGNYYSSKKGSVYSVYNDLYGSGQVGMGTGLMNVGATTVTFDPMVNNPVATGQLQSLVNSYYRNPNAVTVSYGEGATKAGEILTPAIKGLIENTFLSANTDVKGENRYVTDVMYQRATAGDPNVSSYTITVPKSALDRLNKEETEYKNIQAAGGKITIQVPKENDANIQQRLATNIDPIKVRINASPTKSIDLNVPYGGNIKLTELPGGALVSSGFAYGVDGMGNLTESISVNQEPVFPATDGGYTEYYNNINKILSGYAEKNSRQQKAVISAKGVKDPNQLR
jgi:hypothetical protein